MPPSSAPSPLVVGLDIGTTKICAIVAGEDENGALAVLGLGARPSSGVRRGIVVDVPDTVAAIKEALSRAAHMAGVEIEGVVAGVTGDHILSINRMGSVTVASPASEIGPFDVERALAATLLEVGRDREVIHCLPRSFSLDGQQGLRKPLGLTGSRLEVEAHVVTGQNSLLRNTFSCLSEAGVRADALVLEPLATAEAVSTRSERDMGVLVLDIGGGTSDLAAFVDGSAIYSAALPVGGNHVTRDISIGLSTPFEFAETLKVGSGAATRDMIPHGEALEVMTAGGASRLRIPRALLGEIIEARMRELFELSLAMARDGDLAGRVPGGLILSGGGALLPGALELAHKIFGLPVRLGVPEGVAGWREQVASPQFATAVGLCRIALAQQAPQSGRAALPLPHARRVWSQIPRGVVMARSASPQVAPVPPAQPVFAAPTILASEEFPAQLQFAPAVPLPQIPIPTETAPVKPAPPTEAKVAFPQTAPTPVVEPTPVVPTPDKSISVPSAPVVTEPPVERAPVERAPAEQAVVEQASVKQVPVEQPRVEPIRRLRLQEILTRANASSSSPDVVPLLASAPDQPPKDQPLKAQPLKAPAPPAFEPPAPDSSPAPAPQVVDVRASALQWWMRFKTFIGFGDQPE